MNAQRLPWRIILPFAGLVLAGSMALLGWMAYRVGQEEQARFEGLARTNAAFLNEAGLPPTGRMARQLGEVLGVTVYFRRQGLLTPEADGPGLAQVLQALPADGVCRRLERGDAVGVVLAGGLGEMLLVRGERTAWHGVWRGQTAAVLGIYWALVLAVGWLVSRGLVVPLRNLASRLPDIEKPGELQLPEAARPDEIGDVARAFLRTRKVLQEERDRREQAEKLAVLGRMTAALAHEIQNPVAAIKMHAQLAALEEGRGGGAEMIANEAERIEGMVNQWMYLSRPEPPVLQEVDLGAVVDAVVAVHAAQFQHAGVVVKVLREGHLWVAGDRRRLQQVLSNLLVNAAQAMPVGGVVVVKVLNGGDFIELSVRDEGRGFSATALARFAEFFYSEREGGMGIGLSVAAEIARAHGGCLMAANAPGGGAVVTVRLPVPGATALTSAVEPPLSCKIS